MASNSHLFSMSFHGRNLHTFVREQIKLRRISLLYMSSSCCFDRRDGVFRRARRCLTQASDKLPLDAVRLKLAKEGESSRQETSFGAPDYLQKQKLTVAVDVDEVLGSFLSALNQFIADHYSTNHSVSEYHVYDFCKIWKCSQVEANIRVHEFFKTSYFKLGIHPIPGARSALTNLSSFCDLSVVTSRQNVIRDQTVEWIEKYFPGLFREIHFGNHFSLHGASRSKSDICRNFVFFFFFFLYNRLSDCPSCRCLGAQVLIDDNPKYALECAEIGMKVLLFDYQSSYPWSRTGSATVHPMVTEVHDWREVEVELQAWALA